MNDEPTNPLEPLVDAAVPPLDPQAADRIETALRVGFADRTPGSRRSRVPRGLVVGPIVVLLVLVVTVALVARDDAPVAALELRDARNVTVTLPDGAVVADPADGFALVDGAVVEVGTGGRVTIGDVTLAAGTTVTVRDGRLVSDAIVTTTTDPPVTPSAAPPGPEPPDDPATTVPTSVPTAVPPPIPSRRPEPTPTPRPPVPTPTARPESPVPTTSGRPEPPETSRPPTTTSPRTPGPEADVSFALRVAGTEGGARVSWRADGVAPGTWRVVVIRAVDGSETVDLRTASVVGEGVQGELVDSFRSLPPETTVVRYRVVAIDGAGGVVAGSAVHSFARPAS